MARVCLSEDESRGLFRLLRPPHAPAVVEDAAARLAANYLGYCQYLSNLYANKFARGRHAEADFFGEANLTLTRCLWSYDPYHGAPFLPYLRTAVACDLKLYSRHFMSCMHIPKHALEAYRESFVPGKAPGPYARFAPAVARAVLSSPATGEDPVRESPLRSAASRGPSPAKPVDDADLVAAMLKRLRAEESRVVRQHWGIGRDPEPIKSHRAGYNAYTRAMRSLRRMAAPLPPGLSTEA